MLGAEENRLHVRLFHHLAQIHDCHHFGHFSDHTQVVGDVHDRHAKLVLQLAHQVQNLGLGGHIQRSGGLISDQQARHAAQRHGDDGSLAHTTAELERIIINHPVGIGHFHPRQHVDGLLARFLLAHFLVQDDGFGDLLSNGAHRAHRGHRFLKNHRNLVAADVADFISLGIQVGQIDHFAEDVAVLFHLSVKEHIALDNFSRRRNQAQQRKRGDALAAAAFSHHAHRLTALNVQVHAVDCANNAF